MNTIIASQETILLQALELKPYARKQLVMALIASMLGPQGRLDAVNLVCSLED